MPDCRGSDIGGVTGNDAVYRSGLQVVQGGCESVAPVSAAPPGRYTPHSKKPRTFRGGVLVKTQKQKAQSFD
ncbi:hypothetical protein DMS87_28370 [Klebsiella variicola]|nr:hypothetical protein BC497_20075 [Klebsiella variicola]MBX4817249.1 hypothetical protein [Klebsiella variicola]PXK25881.1 hypothetical protein DMR25_28585 [Klebsiella variicola]PXK72322.1 hypothetical protein DMS24_28345 [Klebsiella variicola]PXM42637.1 hypothetical protein DMS87_28370 [Klebsiella variicola]